MDPRNQSPFNALPPVVVALSLVIVAIELMFLAGESGFLGGQAAVGWRLTAIRDWSVAEVVWDWMIANRTLAPGELARFVTYPLIHVGFGHAAFVAVFVLAFGNQVAPFYPNLRILAIFFGSGIVGALAYLLLYETAQPLIGGYPAAYGLIGAFTYLTRRGLTRAAPERAFLLIGVLLAIQPVFGLMSTMGLGWVPDWSADLFGAVAGYGIAAILFPGAIARWRDRIRQR